MEDSHFRGRLLSDMVMRLGSLLDNLPIQISRHNPVHRRRSLLRRENIYLSLRVNGARYINVDTKRFDIIIVELGE